MKSAADYLDAIRARYSLDSDRKAAALLGVASMTVSRWRAGTDSFSDSTARRIAELLDLDPVEVAMNARALAAKTDDDRALWEGALSRLSAHQGAGVCVMSTSRRRSARAFLPAMRIPPAFQVAAFA